MRFIILVLSTIFFYLVINTFVFAQNWYYPMSRYFERQTIKAFGQLIDDNFYKAKEHLFPYNKFYGYHAAVDLEYLPQELKKNIPVYAITSGKIKYIGELEGYGGVILQDIGDDKTALYGHVKIANLSYKVGQEVQAGVIITYLGDQFSRETSREREHLHFGIYKGTDLYFKGHEASKEAIVRKWINPTKYLREKGAILPDRQDNNLKATKNFNKVREQKLNVWDKLILWVKRSFLFH